MEEDKSKISEMLESVSTWFSEQEWFQQLKAKWEELDPQSKLYLQIAGAAGSGLLILFVLFSFFWSVRTLRQEVNDKSELLAMLTSANEELRTLQATTAGVGGGTQTANPEPWPAYFESTAGNSGIPKPNITISDSKSGSATDVAKESLFDLTMKKVSIRQAIRFAVALEGGGRPVKLRNLTIDTQPDASGYLDVTLAVSAFALNNK